MRFRFVTLAALSFMLLQLSACNKSQAKLGFDHGKKPVVIFYHAQWCGYCKRMQPVFAEAIKSFGEQVHFQKIDVDAAETQDLQKRLRPKGGAVPYFQYYNAKEKFLGDDLGAMPPLQFYQKLMSKFKLF